jgi:hypothetical protein
MNKPLTFLILLLAALAGHAQDALPSSFSQDSAIHATRVYSHGYPRLVYNANGVSIDRRDVVRRLELYSEPAVELHRYRVARTGFFVLTAATIAAATGAILESSHHHGGAAWAFGGVGFFTLIGRFSTQIGAAGHLRGAIHIYNKRVEL